MNLRDARVVRSRQRLADALIHLAETRGAYDFSVRDLVKLANVGYRTFYNHYRSLDDLLARTVLMLFTDSVQEVIEEESRRDAWQIIFTMIHDNQHLLSVFYSLPDNHRARRQFRNAEAKVITARYALRESAEISLDLAIDQYLSTCDTAIKRYLNNIDDYTIEEAAAICEALVGDALKGATLVRRASWPLMPRDL